MFHPVIYKILRCNEWESFRRAGIFSGSSADIADGFVHLSTAEQVQETARKHFANQGELVLLAVDAASLGAGLRYEVSRGGALFPHFYGALSLASVVWDRPFAAGDPFPH